MGAIADISRACGELFGPCLNEIIPAFLNCLKNQSFDRELKLLMFTCLGDIALGCPEIVSKYIKDIMNIFNMGFVACI